jgi:hypothetical protein
MIVRVVSAGFSNYLIAHSSVVIFVGVFDDRIIICGLWPALSPDLTHTTFIFGLI